MHGVLQDLARRAGFDDLALVHHHKLLGTLRGQDIAKLVIMAIVIIGVVLETIAAVNPGLSSSLGMYKSLFQTK
ncbi:MAG TPA: hypothetical protein PKL57_15925 [Candidatus Wallbacteria bacterium]|nr:hypothetical protein [Candidatus Wallbacteria bacterium]